MASTGYARPPSHAPSGVAGCVRKAKLADTFPLVAPTVYEYADPGASPVIVVL